jgi:hypothetical protein
MRLRAKTIENYATRVRDKLIVVAKAGETITYTELMRVIGGPGRGHIGEVLQTVCQVEADNSRPLLGALVVRTSTRHPSFGFWETPAARQAIGNDPRTSFWEKERQRVYQYWQSAGA